MTLVTSINIDGTGETVVSIGTVREGDLVADRRVYLDSDGKPVESSDPSRAFLLAGEGGVIPKEQAVSLGLRVEQGRLAWGVPQSEEQAAEPPLGSETDPETPAEKRKPGRPKKQAATD